MGQGRGVGGELAGQGGSPQDVRRLDRHQMRGGQRPTDHLSLGPCADRSGVHQRGDDDGGIHHGRQRRSASR